MKKVLVAATLCAVCSMLVSLGALPASASTPALTASRTTGLLQGQLVLLNGTGFTAGSYVEAFECSDVTGQPTVDTFGFPLAVGCNAPVNEPGYPFGDTFSSEVNPDGTISTAMVIQTGVIGPPSLGLDSAGHNPAADAALYPCPPTPAQQAAGAMCELTVEDANNDVASVPISFGTPVSTSPAISVSPSANLASGDQVTVDGGGFTPDSPWLAIECNLTPGEPTGEYQEPNLPVGCDSENSVPSIDQLVPGVLGVPTFPSNSVTDSSGQMATTLKITEGNIGGSQESAAYPCPPSAANLKAGGTCAVVIEDGAAEKASSAIGITGPVPVPTVTVTPSTGLSSGSTVQVDVTNLVANQPSGVLECSSAAGQPTISYDGVAVPISCSNPQIESTSSTGGFSTSFQIVEGVTGPPATGTDTGGGSASTDAESYPCPPTAAQQAAGATCEILTGDLLGDAASAPISFASSPPSQSASCTGATGNTAFVCSLYGRLLGRGAESAGLGYWEAKLSAGTSRTQVAEGIASSPEYRTDLVESYFKTFLDRPADANGLSFWLGQLNKGSSDESVQAGILGSAEFYADSGSTGGGFVTALYQDVLQRSPDPAGLKYWLSQLAGGVSRTSVAASLLSSTEYRIDFVESQYKSLLGRSADLAGLFYWVSQMDGGASDQSVMAGIAGSPEYFAITSIPATQADVAGVH